MKNRFSPETLDAVVARSVYPKHTLDAMRKILISEAAHDGYSDNWYARACEYMRIRQEWDRIYTQEIRVQRTGKYQFKEDLEKWN